MFDKLYNKIKLTKLHVDKEISKEAQNISKFNLKKEKYMLWGKANTENTKYLKNFGQHQNN